MRFSHWHCDSDGGPESRLPKWLPIVLEEGPKSLPEVTRLCVHDWPHPSPSQVTPHATFCQVSAGDPSCLCPSRSFCLVAGIPSPPHILPSELLLTLQILTHFLSSLRLHFCTGDFPGLSEHSATLGQMVTELWHLSFMLRS